QGVLVPRRRQVRQHVERLVAVLDEPEAVFAVVEEGLLDGRGADGLAGAVDDGPGRVGGDDVAARHAAGRERCQEQRQAQPGGSLHRPFPPMTVRGPLIATAVRPVKGEARRAPWRPGDFTWRGNPLTI